MPFFLVLMIALNIVQANKDAARCKKEKYEAAGCSLYKKALKEEVKK